MTHGKLLVLLLAFFMTACNASAPAEETVLPPSSTTETAEKKPLAEAADDQANIREENGTNELSRFVEPAANILSSQVGDLNADGTPDVVLVLNRAGGDEKLGEGAFRSLLLLVRDASGQLQKAKQNDKIVPCARCGGATGDPFGYVRVEQGAFTMLNEGGSRERWSSEYTFRYSADKNDWLLDKVTRMVTDTITGQDQQAALERNDFGTITFEDFDPSKLPAADMP